MYNEIAYLYPTATLLVDFILEDSGSGVEIKYWNAQKLGVQPTLAALAQTIVPPPQVQEVTMQQARLALLQSGKLALIDAAIAGMSGIQGDAARITWQYSNTLKRSHPLVASMAAVLSLTATQIDGLFTLASTL
jgi:hypothetical protein